MPQVEQINHPEEALDSLAIIFKALSDPARLRILNLLAAKGELCNCNIETVTGYGSSKISRHFSYLKQANLIQSRRDGLWIYYSLKPASNQIYKHIHDILDTMPGFYLILEEDIKKMGTLATNKSTCES